MNPLEPLDAAMLTAELLSDPLHVAALLIWRRLQRLGRDMSMSCLRRA